MRATFTPVISVLFFLLICADAHSQCNTAPCVTPIPSVNAQDACVLPNPAALDCYYGSTTPDPPVSFPPSWCSAIHNNHWFAFTADAPTASFEISCYGCASGNGIQAAVLASDDCVNFTFVSACLGNIPTQTTQTLLATGLTPGDVYFICIDGSGGALCDYSINGAIPTVNGPVNGACIPSSTTATYTTAGISAWSIVPPSAGTIAGSGVGSQISVTWHEPGPAQVCATNVNCPDAPLECLDVNIGEDVQTEEFVDLCQGHSITCAGQTFTNGGVFNVNLNTFQQCDSVVKCYVNLIPKVFTTENVYLCQGQSVECAGQEFGIPGSYPVTLPAWQGCDSVVTCKVNLIPTTISPFYIVNLCGPAEYTLCSDVVNTSGLHTEICTSWQGCDSIVNVNLAILEPQAMIAPPGVIDCGANATITLNGAGSPPNGAIGGTTLYQWTGPGIVGFSNQATVQVNQPGDYCLVVTHGRGGLYCSDTSCVNVTALSAVPSTPQITGPAMPCADSTVVYTATAVGSPAPTSYVWTTPGGVPFTPLGANSIQITWPAGQPGGPLCVTANNSCGPSSPACLPVVVQPAIQIPVMTAPATVCAGGGAYTFTLNVEQSGTSYTWTVPPGATLSGSGDTVQINFLNAPSGQVCVQAQNACGSAAPVCRSVQVLPTPSANLSPDAAICAGDSVTLTFSLGGSAPFDVQWTNGQQNFTLDNIQNGHQVTVGPSQTTTYRLLSVSDNTAPAACSGTATDSLTVTVWNHSAMSRTAQLCQGESMVLGGLPQTMSGVYVDSLQSFHGCDSVITTTLTVYAIDSVEVLATTCDPAAAGTATATLAQTNGCDSIVTTITTLLPSDDTEIFDTDCDPANVGVFTQNLANQYGCDSTVVTTITFALSDTTLLSASTCDPAATGVFTQNLTTVNGCDSLVVTTVSLLASDTTLLAGESCNPAEVGVFTQDLTNFAGCDSTVITTIAFFHTDTTFLAAASCDPSATGVFSQTLVTGQGCDSVIVTTVSLLASDTTQLVGQSCNPAEVGIFSQTLTNQAGCDSTVVTTIAFFHTDTVQVAATSCDPAATGVFFQTFVNGQGCDSVVATTVSLLASDTTQLAGESCNPAEVGIFSQTLTNQSGCDSTVITTIDFFHTDTVQVTAASCDPAATGLFFQTLLNGQGCDSVVATTVTLLASDTTLLFDADCNPANVGVFTQTLTNQAGCDSTVITTITFSLTDTVAVAATSCDPAATGVFVQNLVTPQGCDSTVVTTVTLLSSSTTLLSGESCNPAEVGVFTQNLTNQHGCDSTVVTTVTFFHTDTLQLAATSCDPAAVGVFLQNFVSFQGCDSVVSTTVTLLPSHALELQSTTCDPAAAGVFTQNLSNQFGCDSTVVETVTLLPSSSTTLVFQTCDPTQTGTIVTVLTNLWGCDSTVTAVTSLLPANSCNVQATLAGSNIPCGATTGTLSLLPTVGTAPFNYTVFLGGQPVASGTASALGQAQTIGGLAAGNYTVTVSSPNGFSATVSATIVQLIPPNLTAVALSDFNGFPVSCAGAADGEARATVAGGAPPYTFTWSSGDQTQQAGDLAAGTYSVTVADANNCTAVAAVALGEPEPLTFSFAVNDLDCFGYQDGTIQVEPAGGVPPYRYALSNAATQNSATFNGLSAGTYTVVVSDANDCQQTEIILVDAAVTTDVALGEDQTVALGDSAILQAIVNIPADSILSVAWTPPFDGSECPECLDQIVTPFVSTTYVVRVTALNGCTDEDRTTVFVDRSRHVYAPNVFTPNGDGLHDLFTLYARDGTVLRFRSFQIFDRWGEAVFFHDEFLPGDPDVGWDGRLKGKEMGPGVFVWMVEVEFIDGETVLYKGDVTVMR